MNLREKFIWNAIIGLSLILLAWNGWNLYNKHSKVSNAYQKYKNEKVGSDKELQDMVVELENNLNTRQTLKFKAKENPLDLTRVISLDGNYSSFKQGIDCNMAWSNDNGGFTAVCNYKSKRFEVIKGDSIGGGVVTDITPTKVFIEKDEQILMFNFGLDRYENN